MSKAVIFDLFGVIWNGEVRGVDPRFKELLVELKSNYKIGVITNDTLIRVSKILDSGGISDLCDCVVVSDELGMAKPQAGIYIEALKQLEAEAEQCIFIDDMAINTEAAEGIGMRTIIYSGYDQFYDELKVLLDQ